jgi:chromosome partitioning protein
VANIGAALAQSARSTLLIDLDAQANLSLSCGLSPTSDEPTTYDVLMNDAASVSDALTPTHWPGLSVLPANENLAAAAPQLAGAPRRTVRLRDKLTVATGFDYVLIDTPPSLDFLTLNALTAADWVLIPVQASFLALHGLRQLLQTINAVKSHGNPALNIRGVLVTMYDGRTLHAQQVCERVRGHFGEAVFETVVRRSVVFDYATVAGAPLVCHQPAHPCAQAYLRVAEEVIARA